MFGLDRRYFPLWLIFSENATLTPDHIKMFSYLFHLGFALMVRGLARGVSGDDLSTNPTKKLLCLSRLPFNVDNIFSILSLGSSTQNPSFPPFWGQGDKVYCVFFTGKDCGNTTFCALNFDEAEYFDANNFPYQYCTLI
jgi:hypothetical protein